MIKSLIARARLILNPLMLLVFSAAWIREFLYWLPKDARGASLNYWAYTEWLIDYSQGFIRRGLSGEIWRLVPAAVSRLEFVAVLSWVLILLSAAGYIRLLARSWKAFHPLTLFGLLFLPSLFFFYLHDHDAIARKEILGYLTILLHLLVLESIFPLKTGSAPSENALRRYALSLAPIAAHPAARHHPGPRGQLPGVRPAAWHDHPDRPAHESIAQFLAGRLVDRAAVPPGGAGLRRGVSVGDADLPNAAGHLHKMGRRRGLAHTHLRFAPRTAQRVHFARGVHPHAVVAASRR